MQDANLNSGTPIFKIRILAQSISHDFYWNNPPFTRKTFSFEKPYYAIVRWYTLTYDQEVQHFVHP